MTDKPEAAPPRARRRGGPWQRAYNFLTSPQLAIALLVTVLACCLVGVTVFRGARAGKLIFSTLWFNGLLVLLALSAGAAFFSRIWKRKLTLVSVGMILFHLSFMAMLGGIVYDSLFFFQGVLRLTEGETLPTSHLDNYDQFDQGRFFEADRLRGQTTLVKMHTGYKVDGQDKRAAYEIEVGDGPRRVQGVIYVTEFLDFEGIRFFCMKEGFSVLVVMSDQEGREIYGVHVPLQSIRRTDGTFVYTTGTSGGAAAFPFPPPPEHPAGELQLTYKPGAVERSGRVVFDVLPFTTSGVPAAERKGTVDVGGRFDAGEFGLSPKEVRYWVGINVRYNPGLPIIMTSLVCGLVGMIITFAGRLRQGPARKRAA
jgi:cytochrome c biogenesis protein ResB